MNEFGEFLYALRKEKGMTQAALAEKLNVTNKAVSKWETGEAMPETGLLLPIAEIFGVTVDELLSGKRAEHETQTPAGNTLSPSIEGHLFTRGKDDPPETLPDKICGVICAALVLGGIAVYLFLGVLAGLWTPYWVIIPACALSCGIIRIIFSLCDRVKRKTQLEKGKNPYTDGACGIIILVCIITYLLLGALANLWHPYWIIIVIGAAADGVIGAIGTCFISKRMK